MTMLCMLKTNGQISVKSAMVTHDLQRMDNFHLEHLMCS